MDEEARTKHKHAMDEIEKDPQTVATLTSIQEWREAEIRAINTSTRGIRWLATFAIALAVVAICVTVSFGIFGLLTSSSTRASSQHSEEIITSVACGQLPTPKGCPVPKPGSPQAVQQAQNQAIITQITQGPKIIAKEECVAAAQQLAITSQLPAGLLDDPCDAIK